MRQLFPQLLCWVIALGLCTCAKAQTTDHPAEESLVKAVGNTSRQLSKTNDRMEASGKKHLRRWERQQGVLIRKIARTDSAAAAQLTAQFAKQKEELQRSLADTGRQAYFYIPSLDTFSTAVKFLVDSSLAGTAGEVNNPLLQAASAEIKLLQKTLLNYDKISAYMQSQQRLLREKLTGAGFAKELRSLSKTGYYYRARVEEYKLLLKDPGRASRKAFSLLRNTKPFQDFMRRNSQLASFFRLPGSSDPSSATAGIAGLQTRAQVNGLVQQQISAGGANGMQQFQANVQEAQSRLQEIKNRLQGMGGGSSDDIMPDGFKPNNQKVKRFGERLEYGVNIQTQRTRGSFPVTSDLALTVGYKLSDRSVVGVGAAYKMGLGRNIRQINLTHEGLGLRSFIDIRLKGSFWISGGYEMNYHSSFNRISQLRESSAWQQSGLIGLSKTVSMQSKFFKKTRLQLLWDFLSYQQNPPTKPLLFRIGYNF